MAVITDYCHGNPNPEVPCLFCDSDPDDPLRPPTPWRTADGYAVCISHAAEYADMCQQEDEC